jgi:hypothetical protein
MERPDAERIFALVADLQGELRGRIVNDRWWLIWIVMGLQIPITCGITQWLIWHGEQRGIVFAGLWGLHVALMPVIIAFIHRRSGGVRTAAERCIWWIWTAFIICSSASAIVNSLLGLPLFYAASVIALLVAFSFAMMAMVVHLSFILGSVFFFIVTLLMCVFPHFQFVIYGSGWCVVLVSMGLYFRPQGISSRKPL